MEAAVVIAIVELVLKHGPSMATTLIAGLGTESPTIGQIKALTVEDPESYFEAK